MSKVILTTRKTVGPYDIKERKPKLPGLTKYTVFKGEEQVKDFGRYSAAIRWCKSQCPREVPHVVILLEGGLVQGVICTVPCSYTVLDYDDQSTTDPDLIPIPLSDGSGFLPCYVNGDDALVDPDRIAKILETINKETDP